MATSYAVIVVKLNRSSKDVFNSFFRLSSNLPNGRFGARQALVPLSRMFESIVAGVLRGSVFCSVVDDTGTKPTSSIACVQANAAANYVRWTFGAQTITLTEGTDFARGASNDACGSALATAINAHATLRQLFAAVNASGTVTLTPRFPTTLMHMVTLSTDDATAFTLTQATGGTAGAAQFFLRAFDAGEHP